DHAFDHLRFHNVKGDYVSYSELIDSKYNLIWAHDFYFAKFGKKLATSNEQVTYHIPAKWWQTEFVVVRNDQIGKSEMGVKQKQQLELAAGAEDSWILILPC